MEDAHVANLDIGDGVAVFGVFDGHGGSEVAIYVAKHFVSVLKRSENFRKKLYGPAL